MNLLIQAGNYKSKKVERIFGLSGSLSLKERESLGLRTSETKALTNKETPYSLSSLFTMTKESNKKIEKILKQLKKKIKPSFKPRGKKNGIWKKIKNKAK